MTCSADSGVDRHTCMRKSFSSLEQVDLAIQLEVHLALQRSLLHADTPCAGRGNGLEEFVDAVGLGHIGVGSHPESVNPMLHVVERCEHDHGDQHGRAVEAELAADVEPVDVRQHQVQEQHVGEVHTGQPESGLPILGNDRLEIAQPENPGNQTRLIRMVFHDQSRSHRSVFLWQSLALSPSRPHSYPRNRRSQVTGPGLIRAALRDMKLDNIAVTAARGLS